MHDLLTRLSEIVGSENAFSNDEIDERYRVDIINKYRCEPGFLVRPSSTEQVAEIVKAAAESGTPITPLGGRTGLVGGGQCEQGAIILSLERMNRIIKIDEDEMAMTVEAGAILQTAHEAAEAKGMLLPLDLGARGSATIGGNISTNAGGVRVLRWGPMRDMVIGIEAVLPDGSIVSSLVKTLKDNAGYNWKHLLIGGEGTLGIVTKAILRLRPLPTSMNTAILAVDGYTGAAKLLRRLERDLAGQLSTFELMSSEFYRYVSEFQRDKRPPPMSPDHPFYVLVESMGSHAERDATIFQEALVAALDEGLARDAVIAQSERERKNLWALRDDLSDAFRPMWPFFGFDVSMALGDMERFVETSRARLKADFPDAKIFYYGHAGDGNLHVLVSPGAGDHETELKVDKAIYSTVGDVGGSIAAEHGVGREKKAHIGYSRSPEELALMRSIKRAIDPRNIMNPSVVLPEA